MIEIDGAYLEGGGQIIRTALTLSAMAKKTIRIFNIRANRPNPGLAAQHLTAVRAVRSICRGILSHCEIKSTEFIFEPGEIFGGKYKFDVGTAGSVILVAQTILPLLLSAVKPSTIRIVGGTHIIKSPSYDYFENVFIPAISLFGAKVKTRLIRSGYYPTGGGEIELNVIPSELNGNELWIKENLSEVLIRISGLPISIAMREKKIFVQNNIEKVRIIEESSNKREHKIGNAIFAWNGFRGSCALGEKGKRAENIAQECFDELSKEQQAGGDVDMYLADQLLVYASLAKGRTKFKTSMITNHTKTNAYIISKFSEKKLDISNNLITVG